MIDEAKVIAEHPIMGGVLMAVGIALLRIIYDQKETSALRIILESLICGALTLTAGSALVALGYSQDWYLFCGGSIGFMGSQTIRSLAYKILKRKADIE